MKRRPLMDDKIMTVNLVIVFFICYLLFYIIGGTIEEKIIEILPNIINNTTRLHYYVFFLIKSIVNYGVIVLSIIFGVKYAFKFFVCYKDDGEKVHKYSTIGLTILILYNFYAMYQNIIESIKDINSKKIFLTTSATRELWEGLQVELKIVFIVVNFVIAGIIILWAYKSKDKMIEKCDFKI